MSRSLSRPPPKTDGLDRWVLKFRYISYVHFITLPYILLLSLCFGFTCTPLTLLQPRYIIVFY